MTADEQKRVAALAALDFVEDGMRLGLGTGSTAAHFVIGLAERVSGGLSVVGVPTSEATRDLAEQTGVPLTTLDETPELDLCVDGADEIDPDFNLIKGGGGALLREKIVAHAAARLIVIADGSKTSERLGSFDLPIEVLPFGAKATVRAIEKAAGAVGVNGAIAQRLKGGAPYVTDNGNWIFDAAFRDIADPGSLAAALAAVPGVVEHGLFVEMANCVILGTDAGVDIRQKDVER